MTPLYSVRTNGDQWRITKFVDGDVESSYLTTHSECQCPAGHRHTCRHRQMLPQMLAHKLCDTHWFFCFDTGGQIVDFNGTSKHLLDQLTIMDELAAKPSRTQEETVQDTDTRVYGEIINPKVTGIPHLGGVYAKDVTPDCQQDTANAGSKSWRRL